MLAGLAASLLSGSRGGWLMLALLASLPLIWLVPWLVARLARALACRLCGRRRPAAARRVMPSTLSPPSGLALVLPLLAVALAALAYALPQTGVRERIAIGASDVRLYLAGNRAPTSLSVRLELWRGGLMLVREHPWTGLDTLAYKRRLRTWVAEGRLSPAVFAPPEPPHLHNDVLQVLVTRGVIGLAAWIGILLVPLGFFWTRLRRERGAASSVQADPARMAALAGLLLVLAYASFGLTEVIFWSMKANVFYALTVFLLMGLVLEADLAQAAPAPPDTAQGGHARHPRSRAAGCAARRAGTRRRPATAPGRT